MNSFLCMVWGRSPTLFSCSSTNCIGTLVENQQILNVMLYFWTLNSVSLICIIFMLFPHCLDYSGFEVQFSSVAQSCPTLCDPMNCSTPGLPIHHQLSEYTQTPVHWVGDAIQPSHPLLSPSLPALNLSQHQGLFQWVSSLHQHQGLFHWVSFLHQVAKVSEFQLQHQSIQWIFRTDFL